MTTATNGVDQRVTSQRDLATGNARGGPSTSDGELRIKKRQSSVGTLESLSSTIIVRSRGRRMISLWVVEESRTCSNAVLSTRQTMTWLADHTCALLRKDTLIGHCNSALLLVSLQVTLMFLHLLDAYAQW